MQCASRLVIALVLVLGGCTQLDPAFDTDGDGWQDAQDCAPADAAIHPDAVEVPNALDDDCDLTVDEGTVAYDDDGDGACEGADNEYVTGCSDGSPPGDCDDADETRNLLDLDGDGSTTCDIFRDCDDGDPAVHPGAAEACDGVDGDCDGEVPPDEADADFDGVRVCAGDCDDGDALSHPGADELVDCLDNDCDLAVDEGLDSADDDGDGSCEGADLGGAALECCSALQEPGDCDDGDYEANLQDTDADGVTTCDDDCDDSDATTWPDADELCDALDNDCDGQVPDDEVDGDLDGLMACGGDCDDDDDDVTPWAVELCDGKDNDCDPMTDEDVDGDGDGDTLCEGDCDDADSAINPDSSEVCDGIDNDCDLSVDDGCTVCDVIVPTDVATIQAAIDASQEGDGICLEPGVYAENIDYGGKNIRVVGLQGRDVTAIDGQGLGTVVTFDGGETAAAELVGVTVTGGSSDYGGGIYVGGFSSPTLESLAVTGCDVTDEGGGIHLDGSSASLTDVILQGNWSDIAGAAISVWGGAPQFTRLTVQDNNALPEVGRTGGAVRVAEGASVTISDSSFIRNSGYAGGGLGVHGAVVLVVGSRFAGNSASPYGGAIRTHMGTLVLENCSVLGNQASTGGGLYLYGGSTVIRNTTIASNSAYNGGGVYSLESASLTMLGTLITDNVASNTGGGIGRGADGYTPILSWSAAWANSPNDYSDFTDPTNSNGNISADPELLDITPILAEDWDVHLSTTSVLVDAGDPTLLDPDGSPSDIGAYGGPNAGSRDLDGDGYPEWWQPGPYDYGAYPGLGWDCDDADAGAFPGNGC
jgi:hypothetical protein